MAKYYVSFTSTFESLLTGKLTITDLAGGFLVFGCKRNHVLLPYDQVPIEVLLHNKLKGEHDSKCTTVNRKLIEPVVLDMWDHFAAQIRKANLETRLIFMHEIGHPSYRKFSQETVCRGDEVFWKGGWVQMEKPMRAPVVKTETAPLPDDAFIEQILSETAVGSRSIQGYSHD